MSLAPLKVGKLVKASRDIILSKNNIQVTVLSAAAPPVIKKGTEAEVTGVSPTHVELNCKDGLGHGLDAWGLKIKIIKVAFGNAFE